MLYRVYTIHRLLCAPVLCVSSDLGFDSHSQRCARCAVCMCRSCNAAHLCCQIWIYIWHICVGTTLLTATATERMCVTHTQRLQHLFIHRLVVCVFVNAVSSCHVPPCICVQCRCVSKLQHQFVYSIKNINVTVVVPSLYQIRCRSKHKSVSSDFWDFLMCNIYDNWPQVSLAIQYYLKSNSRLNESNFNQS